ncbi:MAG: TRAP transporter large permease [Oscillibacter sp.]|nr:TRAP transporter large permease [Oscillibacter sp.]
MTTMILTILIFMALLLLGFPVAYAMGLAGLWGMLDFGTVSDVLAAQKCFTTMNSFTLMAVPFYILAGELMNTGGITRKLIRFCSLLLQHWRGALAHANVLVSMIMAGFAGSATADAVSVGAILIPAMQEDGYTPEFSAGVTAASSCIGPIIPPSLTMVIYGGITGLSIGTLFMAGIVPGILIGLAQMSVCAYYGHKERWVKKSRASLCEISAAAWEAKWALVAPVIVLGGIMGGLFTATEAGIVLVIYSILVSVFAYKEIRIRDLPGILNKACVSMAVPCMIICLASLFGQVITRGNLASILCGGMLDITENPTLILMMVIGILFAVGLFLDGTVAMMIFVPVLFPIGNTVGLDPIHFAIIIMITILVGTITPPVGLQLFIAAGIAKVPVTKVVVWPFVFAMVALLVLFTFVPEFVTMVPNLLGA